MRLSSTLVAIGVFVLASLASVVAAVFSVQIIETSSRIGVREELDLDRLTWADADANGLQIFLMGTAPTEAARFEALTAAGRVVDAARVIDQMNVVETEGLEPPRFSVEILRNNAGLSLIGLMPGEASRFGLVGRIRARIGANVPLSDFLETADFDEPEGWRDAMEFAVIALAELPRSKVSVEASHVSVIAMAESPEARARIIEDLRRKAGPNVRLSLDISAPRPVITPFTLRFLRDETGARFDACSADSEEARSEILAAAAQAGLQGDALCTIGLGVPSRSWADAVTRSVKALTELGHGTVTFTDADISLIAAVGTDPDVYDRVVGELENGLPDVFALHAVLTKPEKIDTTDEGPPEFVATLSPEGDVQLRGRINSELSRQTIDSFARARFGSTAVHTAARLDSNLTQAWSIRVMAGLDALARLENGALLVTPDTLNLKGNTGSTEARAEVAGILSERLGEGAPFEIDVTYLEELDPLLSIPTPEECVAGIVTVIGERKIFFEPGEATLDESANDILDDVAAHLENCDDLQLEIAGHTDSQGREIMNLNLSQDRAQSVLDALSKRRVLTGTFRAMGYGETLPIADNGTEEGREANRRIEFTLIVPEAETQDEESAAEEGATEAEAAASESEDAAQDSDAASEDQAQQEPASEGAAQESTANE